MPPIPTFGYGVPVLLFSDIGINEFVVQYFKDREQPYQLRSEESPHRGGQIKRVQVPNTNTIFFRIEIVIIEPTLSFI